MQTKPKLLWMALIEHKWQPGTIPVFSHQEIEPTDDEWIQLAYTKGVKPKDLEVTGSFDLSHTLKLDKYSAKAVADAALELQ
jgi:hypothetical protein